jgi:RNA polymerase sigma factor (sigma-70 family)
MNTAENDIELLRKFVRQGDQASFAGLVRRHLGLVYGTAVRRMHDPAAAEEIAQDVFLALARSAWQFAPDDSLPAWLHRVTVLKCRQWTRGELRRRRREQAAVQLGTTMKTPDEQPALRALVPLLDEALLSLSGKDRAALLLRYIESRSLREVGVSLGVGEDAAQKRVAGALHRISLFFQRRGFRTATTAAAVAAVLEQATTSAPAALLDSIIAASPAPPAATGLGLLLTRLAGLTRVQTAALCLALVATPISWQWTKTNAAQTNVSALESSLALARGRQQDTAAQTQRLRAESTRLQAALAAPPSQEVQRSRAAAQALAGLRRRIVGLVSAPADSWPDNLPLVRVPRWAFKNVPLSDMAFGPKGRLAQWVQEALDLSPDQKTAVESDLADHLDYIDRLADSSASETNWSSPDGAFHESVTVPALGQEAQISEDQLTTNLVSLLGPDGAKLVLRPLYSQNQWSSLERMAHDMVVRPQEFSLSVKPNPSGPPTVIYDWRYHVGSEGPGPIPQQFVPPFLMERFQPWLQKLGITTGVFSRPQP